MIVICPNCSNRYMLDEALLPKQGRKVRCISCEHVWLQAKPEKTTPLDLAKTLHLGDDETQSHTAAPQKKRSAYYTILIVLILAAAGSSLYLGRHFIAYNWPESRKIYALLGLNVEQPGNGLAIVDVNSEIESVDGIEQVKVVGHIVNTSDQVRPIPPLKLTLEGNPVDPRCSSGKSCALDAWEHRLSENSLLPGEKIYFETAPRPAVEGAQNVAIEF